MTMPWSNQGVSLIVIQAGGGFTGLFIYRGPPALGNLADSITTGTGTDPEGNPYSTDITSYSTTLSGVSIQMTEGQLFSYYQNTVIPASFGTSASNELDIQSPTDSTNTVQSTIAMRSGASTGEIIVSTLSAIKPGSGIDVPDTWNAMGPMSAGWSVGGHASYTMLPNGWLGVAFKDLVPGTDTDGTVIWSSANGLPAAYRPSNSHRVVAYTNTLRTSGASFEMGALEFETDGSIQCYGIAAAATRLDLFTSIPLNDS